MTTFETLRDPEGGERNAIEVEVSPEAMHAEVEVDRDVVVQAVLNLLANAAKYGGATQPIEVAGRRRRAAASIAVRDHGPGIPASGAGADLPRVLSRARGVSLRRRGHRPRARAGQAPHRGARRDASRSRRRSAQGATFTIRLAAASAEAAA